MENDTAFEWDQQCQEASESIKAYLIALLALASTINVKPVLLYIITLDHTLYALLAKENVDGKINALYYLTKGS